MAKPQRCQFYAEQVFAPRALTIPERLRKDQRERTKWSVRGIVNEVTRQAGSCPHVDEMAVPVSVYGFGIDRMDDYVQGLEILAGRQRETYTRRGKTHERAQKSTTPILLAAVCSFPEPHLLDTDERRRWVRLVIAAGVERWGKRLRSIIAHEDESHYHLHLLVDNVGASVKPLHLGHREASTEPEKANKGNAYRAGCAQALDWYWKHVGEPMGWVRKSPAPRPRMGRAKAAALRQAELEARAEAVVREDARVSAHAIALTERIEIERARARQLFTLEQRVREREAQVMQELAQLREVRALVTDQVEFQKRAEQLAGGRTFSEALRRVIGGR